MPTPPRPPAQPARPTQPGIPPAPEATVNVNIHGVAQGPSPNMAPTPDESRLSDATRAEMEAGKKALDGYTNRTDAEMQYGKSLVERRAAQKK